METNVTNMTNSDLVHLIKSLNEALMNMMKEMKVETKKDIKDFNP